jgi:hypothetical protein
MDLKEIVWGGMDWIHLYPSAFGYPAKQTFLSLTSPVENIL